jgi:dTDP-glucose pyrophosphorylase
MNREILKQFVVRVDAPIRKAMETINENWREVVLVEDNGDRVVGVITDGDIRRGLLRGLTLDSPASDVMNRRYVSVGPNVDRAAVLDMMRSLVIRQLPVIEQDGRLVGIHFLNDLLGISPKPNAAVIMAGGKGVRLRPLTENCPKPMIQIAGRPILERIVLHLVGCGIRKIYLSINYLGEQIESHFGDGTKFGCSIEYIREDQPLGTGGALSLLPPQDHPVVVMNGDQITQADIDKMLTFHEEEGVEATIGIQHYQVEVPFGVVINEGSRLVALQEKPTSHYLINTGIYVLDPGILGLIPRNEMFPITALFERLLSENRPVGVQFIDEEWIDVGRHDDLRKAQGVA